MQVIGPGGGAYTCLLARLPPITIMATAASTTATQAAAGATTQAAGGSGGGGEAVKDLFEIEDEQETGQKRWDVTLDYGGLVCPDKWVCDFTPLEFEEVAGAFVQFDADKR